MTHEENKERVPVSASLYEELKEACPPDMTINQFTEHLIKNAIEHRQILSETLAEA